MPNIKPNLEYKYADLRSLLRYLNRKFDLEHITNQEFDNILYSLPYDQQFNDLFNFVVDLNLRESIKNVFPVQVSQITQINILKELFYNGYIKEILKNISSDNKTKDEIINRISNYLIDVCCFKKEDSEYCIKAISDALEFYEKPNDFPLNLKNIKPSPNTTTEDRYYEMGNVFLPEEYDLKSIKSILSYIKNDFGLLVFKTERLKHIYNGLVPYPEIKEKDKAIINDLIKEGFVIKLANNLDSEEQINIIKNEMYEYLFKDSENTYEEAKYCLDTIMEVLSDDKDSDNSTNYFNKLNTPSDKLPSDEDFNLLLKELKSFLGTDLVRCPKGKYNKGRLGYYNINKNQNFYSKHRVTISKDFFIGKYPVTQKEFFQIMGRNPSFNNSYEFILDEVHSQYPVECINYYEARAFCQRLNKKFIDILPEGYKFDLPTQAQWEYACRAGTTTSFNNGFNITDEEINRLEAEVPPELEEIAWYDKNSNKQTHPVGQKKPNNWGLYDMHGNVCEWVKDQDHYPPINYTDPFCDWYELAYSLQILKGGSFESNVYDCAASSYIMEKITPNCGWYTNGFRLALVPIQKINPLSKDILFALPQKYVHFIHYGITTFFIGSPENEEGRGKFEERHRIYIRKPFLMNRYLVRQDFFEEIMGYNPSVFKNPTNPVENVTWQEAKDFCAKLTTIYQEYLPEGYKIDLPTEVQWEHCCRCFTSTPYSLRLGEYNLDDFCWYDKNSNNQTHPVAQKLPDTQGCYDMHGNVWEWCEDSFREYESNRLSDPIGFYGVEKVARGGAYDSPWNLCRSASRGHFPPDKGYSNVGFRIAVVAIKSWWQDDD